MKSPILSTAIDARIMPQHSEAWAAVSKAAVISLEGLSTYLLTREPTNKDTIATGPTANCIEEPKNVYVADGRTAAYNPLIGGRFARVAYESAWGINVSDTVSPAPRSPIRLSKSSSLWGPTM
jgi:hypothetical protein